ncbi:MAG: hypothetical protein GX889_05650 [Clostridiales bacterium]|nr:hypothetical protein [Clostridiales bacterium]
MAFTQELNNLNIKNNLDYLSYLALNKYKDKILLIDNISEENLLIIFEKLVQNLIFNKNKILIVSQDSLNTLKDNRIIKLLNGKVINLTEDIDFKNYLKEQILSLPELTGKTYISKVDVISRKIERKIDIILKLIKLLRNKDENNLSLIEKYNITYKKLSKYDYLYNYYKIFRIKKPFMDYSYEELKNAKERIINSEIIDKYLRYRRYIDNSMFKVLQNEINFYVYKEALLRLKELNKRENLKIPLINSKYTKDFLDNYFVNQNMKEEDVEVLANIVNIKYNSGMIKQKEKKSIFKFIYKKFKDTEYEKRVEEFKKIEKDIKDEYIGNLNNLNYYLNEIVFLKEILIEEEYNALIKSYIFSEDIKEKLEAYIKIINISCNIKETINYIDSLEKIELDILDYCYSSLEYKDEIKDLINTIDYLKLFFEIENTEVLNKDFLETSNKYENLIGEIENDLKLKDELMRNSLNLVWNNIIREKLQVSKLTKEKIDYDNEELYEKLFPCILTDLDSLYKIDNFQKYMSNFEKIIIFDNKLNSKYIDFIKDINLKERIILMLKDKYINYSDLIEEEIHKLNDDLKELERDYIKKYSKDRHEIFVESLSKHIAGLGYNYIRNYKIGVYKVPILINDIKLKNKIAILIDGDVTNYNDFIFIDDLYIKKELEDNNIDFYRIWTRDLWTNKERTYDKLVDFLNNKLIYNN